MKHSLNREELIEQLKELAAQKAANVSGKSHGSHVL